jgi:hypothetical protein
MAQLARENDINANLFSTGGNAMATFCLFRARLMLSPPPSPVMLYR